MNSEMTKFFLSSGLPSGFVNSEGELEMNFTMSDLLHSMILSAELKTLIEKVHAEKEGVHNSVSGDFIFSLYHPGDL